MDRGTPSHRRRARVARLLEFEIASRVAQTKVPTWTFAWYEEADLAACTF